MDNMVTKTRWVTFPRTTLVDFKEMSESTRMDAGYYLAKQCLLHMLDELRHDTIPSIDDFMTMIDYILERPGMVMKLLKADAKVQKIFEEARQDH